MDWRVSRSLYSFLSEHSRHSGLCVALRRDARRRLASGRLALQCFPFSMALRPGTALDSTGAALRLCIWSRPGAGHVELRRLRTALQRDRRNAKSTENFSSHLAVEHADECIDLRSSGIARHRRARQLGGLAHRRQRRSFAPRWRRSARRGHADRLHHRYRFPFQQHHSLHHAYSRHHGAGRLPAHLARQNSSTLRNSCARHRRLARRLLPPRSFQRNRPGEHLYLGPHRNFFAHIARRLGTSPQKARRSAAISRSGRNSRPVVRNPFSGDPLRRENLLQRAIGLVLGALASRDRTDRVLYPPLGFRFETSSNRRILMASVSRRTFLHNGAGFSSLALGGFGPTAERFLTFAGQSAGPSAKFPTIPRDRIAIA